MSWTHEVETPARSRQIVLVSLLCAAAIFYSTWILEFVLFDVESPVGYVSELSARGQPFSWLFRTGDFLGGTAAGLAALLVLRRRPTPVLSAIAWVGMAAFGWFTVLDSLLPMSCAPHSDPQCAARLAEHEPLTDQIHLLTSTVSTGGAIVSMLAFLVIALKRPARWLLSRICAFAATGLMVVSTVWTLAAVALDSLGKPADLGTAQRVQLLTITTWLVYAAATMILARRNSGAR